MYRACDLTRPDESGDTHVTMLLCVFLKSGDSGASLVHQCWLESAYDLHPYSAKCLLSHLPVLLVKMNRDLLSGLPMLSCFGPVGSYGKCAQFTKTWLFPGGYRLSFDAHTRTPCSGTAITSTLTCFLVYFLAGDTRFMFPYKNHLSHVTTCSLS